MFPACIWEYTLRTTFLILLVYPWTNHTRYRVRTLMRATHLVHSCTLFVCILSETVGTIVQHFLWRLHRAVCLTYACTPLIALNWYKDRAWTGPLQYDEPPPSCFHCATFWNYVDVPEGSIYCLLCRGDLMSFLSTIIVWYILQIVYR